MMQFIDMKAVAVVAPLKAAHYPLPRGKALSDALSYSVRDYYTKSMNGPGFEARGMLVTGKSRVGKTCELRRVISKFNQSVTLLPDGRTGSLISCSLSGRPT
jgi:hypothetical protein